MSTVCLKQQEQSKKRHWCCGNMVQWCCLLNVNREMVFVSLKKVKCFWSLMIFSDCALRFSNAFLCVTWAGSRHFTNRFPFSILLQLSEYCLLIIFFVLCLLFWCVLCSLWQWFNFYFALFWNVVIIFTAYWCYWECAKDNFSMKFSLPFSVGIAKENVIAILLQQK